MKSLVILIASMFLLSGCSQEPEWWGHAELKKSGFVIDAGKRSKVTLSGVEISDDSLKCLKAIAPSYPHMDLVVKNTRISNTGLEHLKDLPELWSLTIHNLPITDQGLEHLPRNNLLDLDLANTRVSDSGLRHLRALNLRDVCLTNTQVSDEGLEYLIEASPRYVGLTGTQVTPKGIKKLQEALPNSRIEY